jgi:hypothetical protein
VEDGGPGDCLTIQFPCLRRPGGFFEKSPPGPPKNFLLGFFKKAPLAAEGKVLHAGIMNVNDELRWRKKEE